MPTNDAGIFPQWAKLSTTDWSTGTGAGVIARLGMAGYGRWVVLWQMLETTDGARIEIAHEWQRRHLARSLELEDGELQGFLDGLAEVGAIDSEAMDNQQVFNIAVAEHIDEMREINEKRKRAARSRWNTTK